MTDVPTMNEIAAMSPAEAGAALNAMSATPTPPLVPADASARLAAFSADQALRDKLLAGDPYLAKEFHDLHKMIDAGDKVDVAMSGQLPDLPDSELKMMADTAQMLRDKGFSPRAIRETLDDKPATQADVDLATALKNQHMRSPEFIKQFLSGEPDSELRMWAANAILSKSKSEI
jgi:hypothetical protein